MVFLFGGKKKEERKEEYVPTDLVNRYSSEGMSEYR